jgi:hypothetical protein
VAHHQQAGSIRAFGEQHPGRIAERRPARSHEEAAIEARGKAAVAVERLDDKHDGAGITHLPVASSRC